MGEMAMAYEILSPPFSLDYKNMSKPELKAYCQWFMAQMLARFAMLETTVRESPEFRDWAMDFSANSLHSLGHWYTSQIETFQRTPEEIAEIKSKLPFQFDIDNYDLTIRTISLAYDLGMYFGQVMVKSHLTLKWDQVLKDKRDIEYGHPVVAGFKYDGTMDPVHLMTVLAYSIANGSKGGDRLYELSVIWSKDIVSP
jgi:hypothetical protein